MLELPPEGLPVPLRLVPLSPQSEHDDHVVDLAVRRAAAQAALLAVAQAPVRHVPAALLDALQGSWGTPDEVLRGGARRVRLAVAR